MKDSYIYTQKGYKTFVRASVLSERLFHPATPLLPLEAQFVVHELDVPLIGNPVPSRDVSATVSSRYDTLLATSDVKTNRFLSNSSTNGEGDTRLGFQDHPKDFSKLRKRSLESLLSAYPALSRQVLNPLLVHVDAFECKHAKTEAELLSCYDQFFDTSLQIFQESDPNLLSRVGIENDLSGEDLADIVAQFVETKVSWKLWRRVTQLRKELDVELFEAMEPISNIDIEQILLPQKVSVQKIAHLGRQLWLATNELKRLSSFTSADDKIEILLGAIDMLASTDNGDTRPLAGSAMSHKFATESEFAVNADLLLPLIMVMLVRAAPKNFESELFYIEKFTYRDTETGPLGWALVTLSGVVSQIKKESVKYSRISQCNSNFWKAVKDGTLTEADLNPADSKFIDNLDGSLTSTVFRSRTAQGESCLSLAISSRQARLLDLLLSQKSLFSVEFVLSNASWEMSKTLIMSAVETGDKEVIEILLDWMRTHLSEEEQTLYLQRTDCWNRQISHYFFHCSWLIEVFGSVVDWEYKDQNGQTPLFALCRCYDHPQYMELLTMAFGAWKKSIRNKTPSLLDHIDDRGNSILHVLGDEHALELALTYDVDVNWTNDRNRTPLMVYSKFSRINSLKLLAADERTDIYRTDQRGCSSLDFANEKSVVEALEDIQLFSEPLDDQTCVRVTRALVQNGELQFVVKSGRKNDPESVRTVKRTYSDFTFLQKWLLYESPSSWLHTVSMTKDPFSVPAQVYRQLLREFCINMTSVLRVLFQHPTFAGHELAWEFLMVQEMPQQQSVDRCRKKVASRKEAQADELTVYSSAELDAVQIFLEHALDQTKQLSSQMHNMSRCAIKLSNKVVDYCQAVHFYGMKLSLVSDFKATFKSAFHPEFQMAFEYRGHHLHETLAAEISSCYATTEAVVIAISKALDMIHRLKEEGLALDRLNGQLEKTASKTTWQLGLLEDRRQKDLKQNQDKIFVKQREINKLSNEIRDAHITLATELGSYHKIQQSEIKRVLKSFTKGILQNSKEQLHHLERVQGKLQQSKATKMNGVHRY